jgi:recombination protein RecA
MAIKSKNMAIEKINTTDKINTEKEKALELAINQIEKRFGKGSVMKLGENTTEPIDVIPSGSLSLDIALGVGGVPKDRKSTRLNSSH